MKTVDDYLDEVRYGYDPNYKPSRFAIEFVNFIKLVNGTSGEENETPVTHLRMLDSMATSPMVLSLCHRGIGKTTIEEYCMFYIAIHGTFPSIGKVTSIIFLADTMDNGVKSFKKNMEYRWNNSPFLQTYIPKINFTINEWEFTNADGNVMAARGIGAQTGVRGFRAMNNRPNMLFIDDIISDRDASSPTLIEKIRDTIYGAVLPMLHPSHRAIVWSGTPFSNSDPLCRAVESGSFKVNAFPLCEKFPCDREEFRGSWEDRFTYDFTSKEYNLLKSVGKADAFYQEYMLRTATEDQRLINDSDIRWYKLSKISKKRDMFNCYITTDFAMTNESGDFSVILVWFYNNMGQLFLVDGMLETQLMNKNLDRLFPMVSKWKPNSVGIEINGQQVGFIPWIKEKMMDSNIYFDLASNIGSNSEGIRSTGNKTGRFDVVLPLFKTKSVYFPEELKDTPLMVELLKELKSVTKTGIKSVHDDCIDCVSQLGAMDLFRPSVEYQHGGNNDWDDECHEYEPTISSYMV